MQVEMVSHCLGSYYRFYFAGFVFPFCFHFFLRGFGFDASCQQPGCFFNAALEFLCSQCFFQVSQGIGQLFAHFLAGVFLGGGHFGLNSLTVRHDTFYLMELTKW